MIGRRVSEEVFTAVLERKELKDKLGEQLREELDSIKPGECFVYDLPPQLLPYLAFYLRRLTDTIKGLEILTEDTYVYVYKKKG